jgi:exosome complex component CSL4
MGLGSEKVQFFSLGERHGVSPQRLLILNECTLIFTIEFPSFKHTAPEISPSCSVDGAPHISLARPHILLGHISKFSFNFSPHHPQPIRTNMAFSDSIILPGQLLGSISTAAPGPGTHVHGDKILSSITGFLVPQLGSGKNKSIVSVSALSTPSHSSPVLPVVGDYVYGRVTVVTRTQANLAVIAISQTQNATNSALVTTSSLEDDPLIALASTATPTDYKPLATSLRGILRSQDVRMTEKDRVKMITSVAVGDIVRALVVGIGDQGGYFLSTAGNELGVVMAWSARENGCVPLSWCEVGDVVTGEREGRKVAKPI